LTLLPLGGDLNRNKIIDTEDVVLFHQYFADQPTSPPGQ